MRRRHTVSERLSLVGVIERFANGLEVYDPAFARTLAAELHAHRQELSMPAIEEMDLRDVIVTFRMDGDLQLVITGNLHGGPGEVTLRYAQGAFPEIQVSLGAAPSHGPYLFATLDHGFRGRTGVLNGNHEVVEIRSLTTLGDQISWQVRGASGSPTVGLHDLRLEEER
jgi:hypothetical protein